MRIKLPTMLASEHRFVGERPFVSFFSAQDAAAYPYLTENAGMRRVYKNKRLTRTKEEI